MARKKKNKVKVGIIGIGNISGIYLEQMTKVFDVLEVSAVADLVKSRANAAAK
jgi:predicted dehydrogenase